MHACYALVMSERDGPSETASQRAARQLRELIKRHNIIDSGDFERRAKAGHKGAGDAPHASTYRRILAATGKRGPDRDTLRAIAEAFGETLETAFPETDPVGSYTIDGRRYFLNTEDGRPPDPKVAALLDALAAELDLARVARAASEKLNRPTPRLPAGRRRS